MKFTFRLILLFISLFSVCCAEDVLSENEKQAYYIGTMPVQAGLEQLESQTDVINSHLNDSTKTNADFLLDKPELFHQIMQQAINGRHPNVLPELIALYQTLPEADQRILGLARATLARRQGNYNQAIVLHRNLQNLFPEDKRIKLDTAAVLFEDKQWNESERLFQELGHYSNLPESVQNKIHRYLNRIQDNKKWQVSGGISLARNVNINNASLPYCMPIACNKDQAINALGINYRLNVAKNLPIYPHQQFVFKADIKGSNYYLSQNSQYDEALGRMYFGWQFHNAKQMLNFLPFYQAQFSGSNEWENRPVKNKKIGMHILANALGMQMLFSQRHTPFFGSYVVLEGYRNHYREKQRAEQYDGHHWHISLGANYRITPLHMVSAHWSYQRFYPKHGIWKKQINSSAYVRQQLGISWQSHWKQTGGLNTRLYTTFAVKQYQGQALNEQFEWHRQQNRERIFGVALSHDKLSYLGFMPRLVWEQNRINSSHAWARRKYNEMYIELLKQF